jgi:hypothetical protein
MVPEPEDATADPKSRDHRSWRGAMLGTAVAILIVVGALVAWKSNSPKQASGMSVTVNTTVPPDTPPINPRANKE